VVVEAELRRGLAHREICQAVIDGDVDLVVVPTHGRSGIAQVLFGSVAEKVARLAPCPVLTVRPQARAGGFETAPRPC
ncbi:MAG TPA: universal stress protein, partial [Candidatus Hydrogenedentes bacterium]|nr:universal stress protein [Candidatus Hydrogenedentota bacterium]